MFVDEKLLQSSPIVEAEVKRAAKILELGRGSLVDGIHETGWLLKAISCIDLTTLAGDDTEVNVRRLCWKALNPIQKDIKAALGIKDFPLACAAVCVYPAQVKNAAIVLKGTGSKLPIASVATGFPSGQTSLVTRCDEIKEAVRDGATEIDIVVNRSLAISGNWKGLYDEIREMRRACNNSHMKAILAVGELPNYDFVYKAAMACMMGGADFIKTSTGKEVVNATIPVGLVMCRSIRDFHAITGRKIGLKPAGGLRVCSDAIDWLILVKELLGVEWLNNSLFRIGASALLGDIEKTLYLHTFGRLPPLNFLPLL